MDEERGPFCPKCGHGQPWGIEVRGSYDGILFWECPSCRHAWPRFPEGSPLHRRALEHLKGWGTSSDLQPAPDLGA